MAGVYAGGCRWNFTPSLPVGAYCPARVAIARGSIVAGCLPARLVRQGVERGYLGWGVCAGGGWPVLKRVVGLAGARYRVTSSGVSVDNVEVAGPPRVRDRAFRLLGSAGTGVVPNGAVFIVGDAADSWDSRYYGPVPANGLLPMRGVITQ